MFYVLCLRFYVLCFMSEVLCSSYLYIIVFCDCLEILFSTYIWSIRGILLAQSSSLDK